MIAPAPESRCCGVAWLAGWQSSQSIRQSFKLFFRYTQIWCWLDVLLHVKKTMQKCIAKINLYLIPTIRLLVLVFAFIIFWGCLVHSSLGDSEKPDQWSSSSIYIRPYIMWNAFNICAKQNFVVFFVVSAADGDSAVAALSIYWFWYCWLMMAAAAVVTWFYY